ncbi:MAG: hypothetical protein HOL99_12730 [Halieaceae bacterium]|nr:hypothetical protein [Halieaceae bacterium]
MVRRRRRKSPVVPILVIVGVLLVSGGAVTFAMLADVPRNAVTGCSENARQTENTYAILIDTTDALPAIQRQKINNLVEALLESTQVENRFQIYLVDATES